MANRKNFYFKQFVTEAELDDALKDFEDADWNQMKDLGQFGITSGFATEPDPGGPSFNVNVSSGTAVDKLGRRLASTSNILQDISADTAGNPTIPSAGNRRWISVYARYGRDLSDARIDGLSATVHFEHDEVVNSLGTNGAFDLDDGDPDTAAGVGKLLVVAGTEELITDPIPTRPALHTDAILVADLLYTDGDANIDIGQISTARAERFALRFLSALPLSTEFDGLTDSGIKYALMLEATGPVDGTPAGSKTRIYMSTDGLVFTHNAKWLSDSRVWVSDSGGDMSKIQMHSGGIKMFGAVSGVYDDFSWTTQFNLDANPSTGGPFMGLGTDGTFVQQGTSHAMTGVYFQANAAADPHGTFFAYNIPFSAAPSSVTMAPVGTDANIVAEGFTGLNEYGGEFHVTPNLVSTLTTAMRLVTATF